VGAAALAVVLGACGGGASGSAGVIADAGAATSATTARVRTTTIGVDDRDRTGQGFTLYSTGLVDFANGDSSIVMASDGGGPAGTIETRNVGGRSYMRINRGGAWLPSDRAQLADDFPPALALLTGAGALGFGSTPDPSEWLGILDDLADVQQKGHESIDGVETTKYGATFELFDALREQMPRGGPKVPDDGPSDIDIWIDGAGRVRRLVVAIPGTHGPVLIRTDLSDFGLPVHVTAPSPSWANEPSPSRVARCASTACHSSSRPRPDTADVSSTTGSHAANRRGSRCRAWR